MFCSFDMPNPSILLLSGSIATHNQIYSKESALIRFHINTMNSSILLLFLVEDSSSFSVGCISESISSI